MESQTPAWLATHREREAAAAFATAAAFTQNPIYAAISAPGAPPSLLTTAEAAVSMGLRKNTLEIWRLQGKGPRFVKIESHVRYRSQDILAYLEAGLRTSTSDTGEAN